jgi:hypothetical protein
MYSIVLSGTDKVDSSLAINNLVDTLGIKKSTAEQLVNKAPLKVYNDLTTDDAILLVEALNITTISIWRVVVSEQSNLPKVNWNKPPLILNRTLEEMKAKLDPEITGVINLAPNKSKSKRAQQTDTSTGDTLDGVFSDVSETVLIGLSEGLDAAIATKDTFTDTSSLPGQTSDSEDLPNKESEIKLSPGFYNLFLPALKSKNTKKMVESLCADILEWDSKSIKNALSKPIVCVAKEVDHVEGSLIISEFEKNGILLNKKLVSKI